MNTVQIVVIGGVGSGKSHVLQVINDALKNAYGRHAQVCSHDLSLEQAMGSPGAKPKVAETVFVLQEQGEPRKSVGEIELAVHVEATAELRELTETLRQLPDSYAVESAISSTAEASKGQEGLALVTLQHHLKNLCDLQLEQLKV